MIGSGPQKLFSSGISTEASSLLKGRALDQVYNNHTKQISELQLENDDLKKENKQFQKLNEKLLARIEMLNSLIQREAPAHQYYHDYPPQPFVAETIDSKFSNKKIEQKQEMNETTRLKKIYENMIEEQKASHLEEMKQIKVQHSHDNKELTSKLSEVNNELNQTSATLKTLETEYSTYKTNAERELNMKSKELEEIKKSIEEFKTEYSDFHNVTRKYKDQIGQLGAEKE